jgi:hypothetical protein
MKNIIFAFLIINLFSCVESKNEVSDIYQSIELPALRVNNAFAQPFRILKTTISDASKFDQKYGNTNLTIGYVLRFYFYTGIDLNSDKTELISMNIQAFDLQETENAEQVTRDAIAEIRKMAYGSEEFKSFAQVYFPDCINLSKVVNDCIIPTVYEPVCGCNGLTYSNSSAAACDGVINYKEGACP